jgi:hypothetical protein
MCLDIFRWSGEAFDSVFMTILVKVEELLLVVSGVGPYGNKLFNTQKKIYSSNVCDKGFHVSNGGGDWSSGPKSLSDCLGRVSSLGLESKSDWHRSSSIKSLLGLQTRPLN